MSASKYKDLDIHEIKKYLPNRYPFLLIDRVTEVIPRVSAKGYKNVTVNEEYFQGHFPNSPLMPGMIQMESLFQMLSLTVLTIEGNSGKSVRGKEANRIRLMDRVLPGSKLEIETELIKWNGIEGIGTAKGIVNGKEVCSAEFSFLLSD
ncbi:MAG: 3-hydroxyacyl-ACP dehydratase FabZ [Oribacterium sp.]|nr:3-hydroxyacyl-ACP dehydratase FabZ [Oribacterium sp.]